MSDHINFGTRANLIGELKRKWESITDMFLSGMISQFIDTMIGSLDQYIDVSQIEIPLIYTVKENTPY